MADEQNPQLPLGSSGKDNGGTPPRGPTGPGAANLIPINIEEEMRRAQPHHSISRMMRIAGEMLADIDSDTVDFTPNYDESTTEPVVLPARIPNLIVNGSNGIAVGMATNIPPHNLTEVLDATIEMVNNPQAGLAEVLKYVKGPDFPTGGFIYGKSGIENAYRTRRGRLLMRAKAAIGQMPQKQATIVTQN